MLFRPFDCILGDSGLGVEVGDGWSGTEIGNGVISLFGIRYRQLVVGSIIDRWHF